MKPAFRARLRNLILLSIVLFISAASGAFAAGNCVTPPSGLVGWWRAEGNAQDAAGTNNGVISGSLGYGPGEVGQAFVLDGTTASVTVPASPSLNVQSFTIEGWVNPADVGTQIPVAEYAAATGFAGVHLWVGVGSPGTLFANVRALSSGLDDNILSSAPGLVPSNQWSHVAVTFDQASGSAVLYLNGTNVVLRNLGSIVPETALPLNIGLRPVTSSDGGAGSRFAGKIDELSVYNRALSQSEIQSIYQAGSAGKCPPPPPPSCVPAPSGIVGWWPGEGNGNDIVGGDNAIVSNGVTYASGEVGLGFNLNGDDTSTILVPDSPALNFGAGQDLSIEAWIRPEVASTTFGVMDIVDKRYVPPPYPNLFTALGYELFLVNGQLAFQLSDAPAEAISNYGEAGPDMRDGNFHHVAVTVVRNSSTGGRLYVDGQVVLTFDPTGEAGDLSNTEPMRIGNHPDPEFNSFFKGMIDEVSLYNRALSSNEIAAIYNAGSSGKCPPPIASNIAATTLQNQPLNLLIAKILALASDPAGNPLTVTGVSATSTNGGIVALGTNAVTYTPVTGFLGADSFTYTIGNGQGGFASAFVFVQVLATNQPSGNMLPLSAIPGGFLVNFTGIPGRSYTVQRAPSVTGPWTTLGTVTVDSSGIGTYSDTNPPAGSAFYRTSHP
jgi:concanavalin A-like lectin/glucanase superfamily protein/Big-like domain-containing protein